MTAELAIGLAGGGLGLGIGRSLAGNWMLERARRDARRRVSRLKGLEAYLVPLDERHRETASALHHRIGECRAARAGMIQRMRARKLPTSGTIASLPDIKAGVSAISGCFFNIVRSCYVLKVGGLAVDELAGRFDDKLGILRHVRGELGDVEKSIVETLDQLGLVDFAEAGISAAADLARKLSAQLGDAIDQGAALGLHCESILLNTPGLLSAVFDASREIGLLMDDKCSLGDALTDGFIPSVVRISLTKIGVVLDGATGWASLGAFTIIGTWIGKMIGQEMHKAKLETLQQELDGLIGEVRAREDQARRTINDAVNDASEAFQAHVEFCPDIGEEPVLKCWVEDLLRAYAAGLAWANERITAQFQQAVSQLPEPSGIDRLLGIDRPAEMARIIYGFERDLQARLAGLVNGFALAAEDHVEHAVAFILNRQLFDVPELRAATAAFDKVMVESMEAYASSLEAWEAEAERILKEGVETIASVTATEHADLSACVAWIRTRMDPVIRRMRILRHRLGLASS